MTGHIFIYGGVGTGPGEVSINNIKAQLDPKASEYVLHIVSPGGDVFEGYGIYNIIKNSGKKVTTHIEGLCASIATLIAFAGEKIVMNRTSEFMIHNPKITDLKGESSDLRNVANQLDKIKSLLMDVSSARAARNGKPIDKNKLGELYDNETWLNAQETMQHGFADEVVDAIKAVATVDLNHLKMETKFEALSKAFKNFFSLAKIKNEFTETLQDGTIIIVMSEDEDWTGKQVVYEDGSPLPDGDHILASGKTISVGAGVISGVKEAAAADKQNEEMDNKIKELEAQLAEAKAAKETAEAAVKASETKAATAEAKATRIFNQAEKLQKDYLKLAEEAGKTIGDTSEPPKGPVFKNLKDGELDDPMGDMFKQSLLDRKIIKS